jgi:hypothetical protein
MSAPGPPTNLTVIINNAQATLSWTAPGSTGGSAITLYTISDGSGITQTSPTTSKIVTGLSNGKMYTFRITATNTSFTSVPSASIQVLPLAMTSITVGTNFIGKTLVIVSRALSTDAQWERIYDFHRFNYANPDGDTTNTYIFSPFKNSGSRFSFYRKAPNAGEASSQNTGYFPARNVTYIYVLAFISTTQVKINTYEYNGVSTITAKGGSDIITITNTILSTISTFWLGRSAFNRDPFYNGNYSKIALYNGDLFTVSTILTILLNLVTGTSQNFTSYINSNNYAFRPVLDNFMGVIVRRLNVSTGTANATTSNITLVGSGTGSGGYLNILGSFIEVPTAPTNVTAIISSGSTQATVSWNLSINNGGSTITGYRVKSNPGEITVGPVSSTTTSTLVSGLTYDIPYTFSVVAINTQGASLEAASNSITPNGIPNAPIIQTATAGNTEATVNWTTPASNGSTITGYIIERSLNLSNWFIDSSANNLATSKIVTGLANGTIYYFRVYATSSAGNSATSAASNAVTPIGPQSAPTIQTTTAGNSEATVNWTEPTSNGSTITGYIIERSLNSSTWIIDSSANNVATSKIVTGLTNGTLYYFRVYATSSAGDSTASAASNAVTPFQTEVLFTFNDTQNFVGGKLDISHNYTQLDISFNWYSSIDNSFINPILLSNPNNRKYLFIRLEYQKLYIRCIVNYNSNTYTSTSILIQEKYNPELFDYNINVYTIGQKQSLFNTATYYYSNVNISPVFNIDLSLNKISSFLSLNRSLTTNSNLSVNTNGFETSWKPFGERLLEIIAMKIFAHPKARAAISNDTEFNDANLLSLKVYDAFNNHINEFGNYYMGIYDITEVNNNVQSMNISNFNIIFPFYLNGITSKTQTQLFQNGPNVGGSLLVNGQYNIPLLLTFN